MENKKKKIITIVLTVVISVVLLAVMLIALLLGTDIPSLRNVKGKVTVALGMEKSAPEATTPDVSPVKPGATEPAQTQPEETLPADLKSYSVDEATALATADAVVATAGGQTLTNAELQIYYRMYYSDFLSQYYYYLSYIGLDPSKPLDQQICDPETNMTWQELFVKNAIGMWHQYTAIKLTAESESYALDATGQKYVDEIDDTFAQMLESSEYAAMEEMLHAEMGVSATEDAYRNYMLTGHYVVNYMGDREEALMPTMEQINAHYEANQDKLIDSGVVKNDTEVVDVRHVLIIPEGGTTDETTKKTVYSDAEWEACRQKAQALLDQWLAGEATEDSFSQLAMEHSADGNANRGGLYTGVTKGYMVEPYDTWIFDESRVYGDSGLVKTEFGYHIMYFVKREPQWVVQVRSDYVQTAVSKIIEDAVAAYPIETNYDAVAISPTKEK